jgi:hypothetical protein
VVDASRCKLEHCSPRFLHCSQAVPTAALSHFRLPDLHCRHAEPSFMTLEGWDVVVLEAGNGGGFSRGLEPAKSFLAGDPPETLA